MSKKLQERAASSENARQPAFRTRYLFRVSLLCMVIILLGGAFALLIAVGSLDTSFGPLAYPARAAQAGFDDLSVVGPPSLPAATVNAIFSRLGSPMSGTGAIVEQMSQQTRIDDAFALGVWWTETNDGAAGVGLADHNPGGVRGSAGYPSAHDGYTIYPDYSSAIVYWFHLLRNQFVDRGLTTVYAISHPYVGTSSSPLWAGKVTSLLLHYRGEAPSATTPAPTPTFSPNLPHHRPAASGADLQAGAQHAAAAVQPGLLQQDAQPATAWWIALAALLLALAIVLWAVKFLPDTSVVGVMALRLPSRPMSTPDANPASLFAYLPETPGTTKIRRTVLVPSRQDDETTGLPPHQR
jgi:hypothetical protein